MQINDLSYFGNTISKFHTRDGIVTITNSSVTYKEKKYPISILGEIDSVYMQKGEVFVNGVPISILINSYEKKEQIKEKRDTAEKKAENIEEHKVLGYEVKECENDELKKYEKDEKIRVVKEGLKEFKELIDKTEKRFTSIIETIGNIDELCRKDEELSKLVSQTFSRKHDSNDNFSYTLRMRIDESEKPRFNKTMKYEEPRHRDERRVV